MPSVALWWALNTFSFLSLSNKLISYFLLSLPFSFLSLSIRLISYRILVSDKGIWEQGSR